MNLYYSEWLQSPHYQEELQSIENPSELQERFHQVLPFGTGGMRGKLGAGTNRINIALLASSEPPQ